MPRNKDLRRVSMLFVRSISAVAMLRIFGLCVPVITAQSPTAQVSKKDFTRIMGAEDKDLVVPEPSSSTVQRDGTALQIITAFVATVSGGIWTGMQAQGVLTSPGTTAAQYPATLTMNEGDSFRLDVSATEGQRSIRIRGKIGTVLESNGVKHSLPLATATGGIFAFPRLLMSTFPSAQTSVFDRGTVVVDGKSLQLITVQEPASLAETPLATDQPSVVDLYFDPSTHLLVKSMAAVQLDTSDRQRYLQAVTYGDYRPVDGIQLPFSYSQTLNGQRQWSLQLTNVQLNSGIDISLFTF
jgi:hypothetical protein